MDSRYKPYERPGLGFRAQGLGLGLRVKGSSLMTCSTTEEGIL